ncbi:MAG: DUF4395 family protein [Patescibacteria group bacterium]
MLGKLIDFTSSKPELVNKNSFSFCRYTLSVLIWLSLILQSKELVIFVTLVFGVSFLLTVKSAPMIMFFDWTFARIIKSPKILVDATDIRLAHLVAFIFGLINIVLLYTFPRIGWSTVFIFAIVKTISAFGYCPASKLRACLTKKGCCSIVKKCSF